MNDNENQSTIWLLLVIILFFVFIFKNAKNVNAKNVKEMFYLWNIPTRWPRSTYDLRGYPYDINNYHFIHRGKIFNSNYLNLNKYPDLWYYLPYYNNGMIYTSTGSYEYDQFTNLYPNFPILYNVPYTIIDWVGLINNGIVKKSDLSLLTN